MGRCGMQRVNLSCVVVVLSVALLVCLQQVQADSGWFPTAGSEVLPALSRGWAADGRSNSLDEDTRRILATTGSYIGYGALTARRVPCPAGSGRSYYTPNCQSASGPVRPYTRGCAAISRCARG